MSRILAMQGAVASAVSRATELVADGRWVVIVCPDGSDFHQAYLACAGALFPVGTFSGRTAVFPDGGKVSIRTVGATPFMVQEPYDVMFRGWGDDAAADSRRMQVWRQAARQVLP